MKTVNRFYGTQKRETQKNFFCGPVKMLAGQVRSKLLANIIFLFIAEPCLETQTLTVPHFQEILSMSQRFTECL